MSNRDRLTYVLILGFVAFVVFAALASGRADAHQPYGGCAEAYQAPQSAGANHCRKHGWIVRSRLVVGPGGYVKYLPPRLAGCEYEDSRNCYWNASTMGNGGGDSFVDLSGRTFYVKGGLPR